MQSLNDLSIPAPDTLAMRHLTERAMRNDSTQNITIFVQVDNSFDINNENAASEVANTMRGVIIDTINKGIQSREINLTTGGRL